ncbi:hypothetical protein [Clostridium sp.]|uniref:hypothetical protein n=1 Tax=Clostridium sp. TaxID=1506 RepID=UPI002841CF34|nr:hypothetical protein [Clostridium sp.]MDR3595097.1 hypothetical protein [Clostridium sp.]
MEIWIGQDTLIQLPVLPQSYSVKTDNNNVSINVESVGELNILGETKLSQITLASFFPSQNYTFCTYTGFPTPKEFVSTFETWRLSKKPIRLVMTGTPVNDLFSIESFEYGQNDGTMDINFTLSLKRYKVTSLNQAIVGTHGAAFTFAQSNLALGSNIL